MKREDLKVGTEVYVRFADEYKKAVVIKPTRELYYPEAIMIRVPLMFEDGYRLIDLETFPDLLHTVENVVQEKTKQRVYISGPISGLDINMVRADFQRVEYEMIARGYEPVNPVAEADKHPEHKTTHDHMRHDIELLMTCDYIYLMHHWTHSKGCQIEFEVATSIGLPVMFEESGELTKFE